jgi:hypothetical protein
MEVLRNSDTKARPLFRVISEDGVQVMKLTTFCLVDDVLVNNFEESFFTSLTYSCVLCVLASCRPGSLPVQQSNWFVFHKS